MIIALKILYWLGNALILYGYFTKSLFDVAPTLLIIGSIIWVVISIVYGTSLAKYEVTRGRKGSMM